ncbi:MAG: hypothetical protein Q4G33_12415 [bacterium]|nr:hypothetical protein [bacterium]
MKEKKFDKVAYDNDYIREKYDRLTLTIPKGKKALLKEYCQKRNISINKCITDYILRLLYEDETGTVCDNKQDGIQR